MKREIRFDDAPKQPLPLPWLWGQVGYASTVALVSSLGAEGQVGVEASTWHTPVGSNLIMIQCATHHRTFQQIQHNGEFVVNFPTMDILNQVILAGRPDKGGAADEASAVGLTPVPSMVVAPPRIAECTAHLECRMLWYRETEERAQGTLVLIVAEVVAASVDDVDEIYRGRILYTEDDHLAPCPVDDFRLWPATPRKPT